MDGIINVYKEKGFTSFDVVAKLRGILKQKKIGHTGTLDPDAVGVLPVCLGTATRACEMLLDRDKEYEAVLLLGTITDTQDTSGKVLETRTVTVSEQEAVETVMAFEGEYDQIPPMYSALKVNGQKLCDLARAGKVIERQPRRVTIYSIRVLESSFESEEKWIRFSVRCSKGTYIRALCEDIGNKLGCGGCMKELKRTKAGAFLIADSLTLDQIEQKRDEGKLAEILMPTEGLFLSYPSYSVTQEADAWLWNGNKLNPEDLIGYDKEEKGLIRVSDSKGQFLALYQLDEESGILRSKKMFLPAER